MSKDISLKEGRILSTSEFPSLNKHIGETLITADGSTLLGADDKAGIAGLLGMLKFFERKFREQLAQGSYDFVMSTNFFPLVAKICFDQHIKYISWIYDSPINAERIEYYQYPTSYIFLFDRIETERIIRLGGQNIYHLPLAANFERLSKSRLLKRIRMPMPVISPLWETFMKVPLSSS